MSTQAPAKQPKITYSAVGGNMDEIHAGFEAALAKVKAGLGATHHLYIAGEYVRGEGAPFTTRSPIDRTIVVGEFTTANDKQIDAAVQAAKRGQKIWGSMPWEKRLQTMRRAAEAIRTH
ncbi:MAG TPA: aldehyde dehydrogenase family protein, partial [Candidatus Eremiobacteraceae bacterium]|nr:aldehyde dehydrogenase family protein [Candidatus Eremiobacteraceae bacterium]